MSMRTTIWLGLTMGVIAMVNVGLMAWLWRFPMRPDPAGRDPHGVSSAPRSWTNVHRVLGYIFALVYLALLIEMVPRAWEFRVASEAGILHGVLGLLVAVLLTTKISSGGLLFLPYLMGERTPNLPQGVGVFHGLTLENTTTPLLARATMEGVTLGLAYGMERFRELGLQAREVRLTGGGSKSPLWRQIAADVFGVQTVCLETSEGAALGAAIQARWNDPDNSTSLAEMAAQLVTLDKNTRALPDAGNHALYEQQLSRLKGLTRQLQSGGYL